MYILMNNDIQINILQYQKQIITHKHKNHKTKYQKMQNETKNNNRLPFSQNQSLIFLNKNNSITSINNQSLEQQHRKNNKSQKQAYMKLSELQEYIGNVFTGCSMPPLNQFLDLKVEVVDGQEKVCIKLEEYKGVEGGKNDLYGVDYVYYMESGKIVLRNSKIEEQSKRERAKSERLLSGNAKNSSNKKNKPILQSRNRQTQIKQNSFFIMTNIRRSNQLQDLYISDYEKGQSKKCIYGKIKIINGLNWYIQESIKYQFLNIALQSQNQKQRVSEYKVKGLARFFTTQQLRRGSIICSQGQQIKKLYVVKHGQCQFSKSFSYTQKNHSNVKIMKIANCGPGTVLSSQPILYDFRGSSKSVHIATAAMSQIQNSNPRINFKMQASGISNFTITALSSYIQIFQIQLNKFKQLCQKYVPQLATKFRQNIEPNYITLLRTTKQKLNLQLVKIQRNQLKINEQRDLLQSKIKAQQFQVKNYNVNQEYKTQSPIKLKRSELVQSNLQGQNVQRTRGKRLQKKIQLLLQAKKTPINYKKKIQIILNEKFNPSLKRASQDLKDAQQENQQNFLSIQQKMVIKKDLQSIFMNNQQNYRSTSIQRQNQILVQKQNMLKKRYSSTTNMLIVHQEFYDKNKNKLFRMDLIRKGALNQKLQKMRKLNQQNEVHKNFISQFSHRTKKQCMQKINKANKIKQQFMTIKAQCQKCHCYDEIQKFTSTSTSKDFKMQTMKTGSAWRTSQTRNSNYQQPLEKLHSRTKLLSEKASRKYHHGMHLLQKGKRFISANKRRFSAPHL